MWSRNETHSPAVWTAMTKFLQRFEEINLKQLEAAVANKPNYYLSKGLALKVNKGELIEFDGQQPQIVWDFFLNLVYSFQNPAMSTTKADKLVNIGKFVN